jgi:hypothetical protein
MNQTEIDALIADNKTYVEFCNKQANEILELQQQSAMQQLEIMRLRKAFGEMVAMQELEGLSCEPQREILDTPTTYDDLMAWHNEQLGKPMAWMNISENAGFKQIIVFQEPTSKKSIPLYAKKG